MKSILFLLFGFSLLSVSFKEPIKPAVHIVKMEGMNFSPKVLEIKEGETVRWVNESSSTHNVVANDKSFKSAMLTNMGDQFEYTFKTTGVYQYFCQPHKMMGMKGSIVVKK